MNAKLNGASYTSTNPENLVKIGTVLSDITCPESRPLKNKLKIK